MSLNDIGNYVYPHARHVMQPAYNNPRPPAQRGSFLREWIFVLLIIACIAGGFYLNALSQQKQKIVRQQDNKGNSAPQQVSEQFKIKGNELGTIFRDAGFNWSHRDKLFFLLNGEQAKYYVIDCMRNRDGSLIVFFAGFLTEYGRETALQEYNAWQFPNARQICLNVFAYRFSRDGSTFERLHDGYYLAGCGCGANCLSQKSTLVFYDPNLRPQWTQNSEVARLGYAKALALL